MRFTRLRSILLCLPVVFATALQAQTNLPQLSSELAKKFTTKDTLFKEPYVDVDEWRDAPVRHRYIHGGFKNTNTRFSFYFPPKEQYLGRSFQYITPFPDNETLLQGAKGEADKIGFAISSGAYFIETNGGGRVDFYLGANPPASLLKARIQKVSKIKAGVSADQAVSMKLMVPMSPQDRGTADAAWKSIGGGILQVQIFSRLPPRLRRWTKLAPG
ncbi:hypothetical protein [Dyadobacter pollutisoli]|uniref:Uncharacterized protein n=1 Tax=Dyadobacter pollutisoli TaxID=2910158 RepID=A0A9E8SIS1_9BACT|nr:hypothetical protein [Dyadobacter pollutisoli]WAC10098.1 hypothetical protein ON006_20340 [Dyadobacter pollutisoli]